MYDDYGFGEQLAAEEEAAMAALAHAQQLLEQLLIEEQEAA